MHLFLQMSKLQETTSYFDENVGRVGVKSDTVQLVQFCNNRIPWEYKNLYYAGTPCTSKSILPKTIFLHIHFLSPIVYKQSSFETP